MEDRHIAIMLTEEPRYYLLLWGGHIIDFILFELVAFCVCKLWVD